MVPIFFDARQSVPGVDSYSPSADKPERFVRSLQALGPVDIRPVTPVTRDDICQVHDIDYVDGVFSGAVLNGFENTDPRVPEACLWTCGSMLSAARHVLEHGDYACSPTSGFHHAMYEYGGGYCTFNGLMVTVAKLVADHPGIKIGILDCDYHAGDGTADILKWLPELARRVIHQSSGFTFNNPDDTGAAFFHWLHRAADKFNSAGCDVVLYQAGADMCKADPLGGLLTESEMRMRDIDVFTRIDAPIAWNLAGGYQEPIGTHKIDPVLRIHTATLSSCRNKHSRKRP